MADIAKNIMFENPALLKRLAKYTVQQCFRNTVLEDYHAGTGSCEEIDFSERNLILPPADRTVTAAGGRHSV